MNYFTTTELRTHDLGLKDLKGFKDLLRRLVPQKLVSPNKRRDIYRRHLVNKYKVPDQNHFELLRCGRGL